MTLGACRQSGPPEGGARPKNLASLLVVLLLALGCASHTEWVKLRETPHNPLAETLKVFSPRGPQPTPRTLQLLRKYDLISRLQEDRSALLSRLQEIQSREPSREHDYALAELAYLGAKRAELRDKSKALEFYGISLVHAYQYLFDDRHGLARNPYDPQFRGACDLYNQALEGTLRIARQEGKLRPGQQHQIKMASHWCQFDVHFYSSGWHNDDFDRFEFVSDYQVQGLQNHYHTYGLGVPLIALRRQHEDQNSAESFYPPQLAFPVTAFLRVQNHSEHAPRAGAPASPPSQPSSPPHFVLELHDPLDRQTLFVAGCQVPLESDLSTPLAYFLNQPEFQDSRLSTAGLLNPDKIQKLQGLYMLEPYDPQKIPVLMVHGLWSSPVTWMEMYNDLRSDPIVRQHYQFWFYLYPTGQPFWYSAAQMRNELADLRAQVDPMRERPALDQMVLVGHSMGGLLSKLQAVDSEELFWQTISKQPIHGLQTDVETKEQLARTFYFRPNPSVRSVVTIGTPHQGSPFANDFTKWLGRKLIATPMQLMQGRQELLARNRDALTPQSPLKVRTSIDSLAPDSPFLMTLRQADSAPWVQYHNIVGRVPREGLQGYLAGDGDGVVSYDSASLEGVAQVKSQLVVPADHVNVHRHPQSVLEVRRILLEQLHELRHFPYGNAPTVAASAEGAERSPGTTAPYGEEEPAYPLRR